ncbi:MAG: DUF6279 family lipoprotein [Steroidobacteraceae bacterium]
MLADCKPRHGWRLPMLLCGVLALVGCSSQFVYNRLDTVAYLYLKTQVSLQDLQSSQLRGSLREFLAWHRSSELPRYAELAQSLARDAAQPLGRPRIDQARLDIEGLWRDAVARMAPDAARFLAGLSRAQRDELFASLGEDDAELREEYCDTPEPKRRRRQLDGFIETAEDWVGRLTPAQRELVAARLAALRPTSCGWVDNRIRVRQAFRQLLERPAAEPDSTGPGWAGELRRLMTSPEERWDPAYRSQFEANRDAIVTLLAELDASLTQRQRARLSGKLTGYARDFRALSAVRGAPAAARD